MSIRTAIAAKIKANTPPGGNATGRTRALIYTLISKFYPIVAPIDASTLPVCEWDDAEEWIYAGDAHSMMIGGQVTPLRYGQRLSAMVANEARASGLEVIPIRAGGGSTPGLVPPPVVHLPTAPGVDSPLRSRRAHKAA